MLKKWEMFLDYRENIQICTGGVDLINYSKLIEYFL